MEGLVDVVEGIFGRYVLKRGAGLDEMPEVIRVELLVAPEVLVEDQEVLWKFRSD